MAIKQEVVSRAFSFILQDGTEIFPVRVKGRQDGIAAFRVSIGGKGGNKAAASESVDEATMIQKTLHEGYATRCSSLDGARYGLYKAAQRSVREVRRNIIT